MALENTQTSILYIEDDVVDTESVRRHFAKIKEPVTLFIAKNGIEALNMLLGRNGHEKLHPTPSAILLDINLPKMNGIEFLTALRNEFEFKSTLVFVVTAAFSTKDKLALKDLNIAGCIIKPLQHKDVLNIYWCASSGYQSPNVLF